MSVASAKEAPHLKLAYYPLLLHLRLAWVSPSFGLNPVGKTVLHFPCAAEVGSVVEVGTACRHGIDMFSAFNFNIPVPWKWTDKRYNFVCFFFWKFSPKPTRNFTRNKDITWNGLILLLIESRIWADAYSWVIAHRENGMRTFLKLGDTSTANIDSGADGDPVSAERSPKFECFLGLCIPSDL